MSYTCIMNNNELLKEEKEDLATRNRMMSVELGIMTEDQWLYQLEKEDDERQKKIKEGK